jgi:2-iminobutanoate/2-iminopropanoate deaminase
MVAPGGGHKSRPYKGFSLQQKEAHTKNTNRRRFLKVGVAAGATAAAAAAAVPAAAKKKEVKETKKVLMGDSLKGVTPRFNAVVAYGNLVFIAGVGYHHEGDIKVHTKAVLDQIQQELEKVGSSMDKVLKCNVYLADGKDYDAMNEVYQGRFGPEPPVRTTVAAAWIPGKSLIEIDVIAYL